MQVERSRPESQNGNAAKSPIGAAEPSQIQDYGIIGDCRSAALVSRSGAIDWLCWPQFESPSLFAAVLDPQNGGTWSVSPRGPYRAQRAYLNETNILVTLFETLGGDVRLTDFMPALSEDEKRRRLMPEHELLRIVECVRGEVDLELRFQPRPDYGRKVVPLRSARGLGIRLEDGGHLYTLRVDGAGDELELRDGMALGRLRLRAGQRVTMSLTFDAEGPAVLPPLGDFSIGTLEQTARWWRSFARQCTYDGAHREQVVRSLLALKLLSYAPTGAIVAAPTTSLPERVGGDLNWDYRYCWLRDASLTVRALLELGYPDEASAFVSWLLHSTRLTRPELCVLYDVHGGPTKDEQVLDHLAGYRDSRPVRVGNAASNQLQLDVYGEVIDAVAQLCRRGASLDRETQKMLRQFGEYVCRSWSLPDQGIWEPRGGPKHYTHSRVLCWTALDRLIELQDQGRLAKLPRAVFEEQRHRIRSDVEAHAWNTRLGAYTQELGGETMDASVLLLSQYGFKDARDRTMRSTFERIVERLEVRPGLFWRYEKSKEAGEGAFGICSFWAAEFLARGGGTLEEAERCFESILPYANDLGLFAEEMDVETGTALGNFPQAFTHVGLVGAALAIDQRRKASARPNPQPAPRPRPEATL